MSKPTEQTERTAWYHLSLEKVLQRLQTDENIGLSDEDVERLERLHGKNQIDKPKQFSLLSTFVTQFQNPLIYILLAASLLSVVLQHYKDGAVILAVVTINAVIGTWQEGRAERSMEALRQLAALQTRVIRNGQESVIIAESLVPGDIILLTAGDAITADARVIESNSTQVSEAALTGESVPTSKQAIKVDLETPVTERFNMLFAGTHLTSGRSKAVVVETGSRTEVGKIASLTEHAEPPPTPLERKIGQLGKSIGIVSIGLCICVVTIGLFRHFPLSSIFLIAVSELVSIIPEGLPVAVSIALAVGMQRMAHHRAIVRRMAAVESLGSTNVICSDKTGTLTRNEMTVSHIVTANQQAWKVTGIGYQPKGELLPDPPASEIDFSKDEPLSALLEAAVLCNDARLVPPDQPDSDWTIVGDPTEAALLTLASKANINQEELKTRFPRKNELPFDADEKLMATQHKDPTRADFVLVKGAPEALFSRCSHVLEGQDLVPWTKEHSQTFENIAQKLANQALRVLAFARMPAPAVGKELTITDLQGLTWLGLVGQLDPPREEAIAAVKACKSAGIRPIMLTGDHRNTGLAVARSLGMAGADAITMDGVEVEECTDEELQNHAKNVSVFARVHPSQKLRIVQALQAQGAMVTMTGDGVNDAPALAQADVGVAMGKNGTEVAKNAADIVITDDNFATIVEAVEQGRIVYRNIQKALLQLVSTASAEIFIILLSLLSGLPMPLTAAQILWLNVVAESPVTVNLVMEPGEGDEMSHPPVSIHQGLFTSGMIKRIAFLSITIIAITLGFFFTQVSKQVPLIHSQSATFTLLVFCKWFNVLNCRSSHQSAFRKLKTINKWLVIGLLFGVAMQMSALYFPPFQSLLGTQALAWHEILPLVGLASIVLWVEEIRKGLVHFRKKPAESAS
jgi:magnesium-transporting ATPase (P-type)